MNEVSFLNADGKGGRILNVMIQDNSQYRYNNTKRSQVYNAGL